MSRVVRNSACYLLAVLLIWSKAVVCLHTASSEEEPRQERRELRSRRDFHGLSSIAKIGRLVVEVGEKRLCLQTVTKGEKMGVWVHSCQKNDPGELWAYISRGPKSLAQLDVRGIIPYCLTSNSEKSRPVMKRCIKVMKMDELEQWVFSDDRLRYGSLYLSTDYGDENKLKTRFTASRESAAIVKFVEGNIEMNMENISRRELTFGWFENHTHNGYAPPSPQHPPPNSPPPNSPPPPPPQNSGQWFENLTQTASSPPPPPLPNFGLPPLPRVIPRGRVVIRNEKVTVKRVNSTHFSVNATYETEYVRSYRCYRHGWKHDHDHHNERLYDKDGCHRPRKGRRLLAQRKLLLVDKNRGTPICTFDAWTERALIPIGGCRIQVGGGTRTVRYNGRRYLEVTAGRSGQGCRRIFDFVIPLTTQRPRIGVVLFRVCARGKPTSRTCGYTPLNRVVPTC